MDIADIYEKFDQIGCLTFATIDKGTPQTRIAHLFAYDHEGLYFRTMITKPFFEQLKKTEKVSICGMFPKTSVSYNEQGMPYFAPGYTIRATGDIKEISFEILKEKAAAYEMFMLGVKDIEKYPAMTTFCLYSAWGEVYDFDFEMEHRSHKLLRTGFCLGGKHIPFRGVRITEECIACGECQDRCSFKAIYQDDEQFIIDHTKCDVCDDCYTICPTSAIEIVIDDPPNRPTINSQNYLDVRLQSPLRWKNFIKRICPFYFQKQLLLNCSIFGLKNGVISLNLRSYLFLIHQPESPCEFSRPPPRPLMLDVIMISDYSPTNW